MGAVVAPWPFLDGGATAVLVATIFDGATVEEELLWRDGGRVAARPGGGEVEVRLGAGGFELVLPRACDGEVEVGDRAVALRELSLCGVTVLPLGPRTRVTVRAGLTTVRVVATTPPRRLPLGPPVSWRQRLGVAVAALAGATFVVALHARAPKTPSWTIPDTVRVRVSLLLPSLPGGRAPSSAADESAAHAAARAAAAAAAAKRPARTVANRDRARRAAQQQAQAQAQAQAQQQQAQQQQQQQAQQQQAQQQQQEQQQQQQQEQQQQREREEQAARAAALAAARPATTDDDARRAAAVEARAAGIVGALAHSHAAFLGDVHVAGADFTDVGSFAVGAGDASSSAGASGASSGGSAAGASSGGSAAGASSGGSGSDVGTLSGDEVGEAYGVGGLGLGGTGEGGGGSGLGTIGLGTVGTIGCGCGTGEGVGYGSGIGGLAGHRASVPDLVFGRCELRGSCDKDSIRRVVHAHVNELRFCYERVLQSRPALAGRVAARFVIGFDGRVTASAIAESSLPTAVDACVAQAIARWQFAPRCVAEVNYPFDFQPVASAP